MARKMIAVTAAAALLASSFFFVGGAIAADAPAKKEEKGLVTVYDGLLPGYKCAQRSGELVVCFCINDPQGRQRALESKISVDQCKEEKPVPEKPVKPPEKPVKPVPEKPVKPPEKPVQPPEKPTVTTCTLTSIDPATNSFNCKFAPADKQEKQTTFHVDSHSRFQWPYSPGVTTLIVGDRCNITTLSKNDVVIVANCTRK